MKKIMRKAKYPLRIPFYVLPKMVQVPGIKMLKMKASN